MVQNIDLDNLSMLFVGASIGRTILDEALSILSKHLVFKESVVHIR